MKTFDELRENISLLKTESDRTIYGISELKIDSIEEAIYHASVLLDIVSELDHINNEKQLETGESFSFISEKSMKELWKKVSSWNREIKIELERYEAVIVDKVNEIFSEDFSEDFMGNTRTERATELAKQHWSYIEKLLATHGESEEVIAKIGFHYRTAFIHGFKHADAETEE